MNRSEEREKERRTVTVHAVAASAASRMEHAGVGRISIKNIGNCDKTEECQDKGGICKHVDCHACASLNAHVYVQRVVK